MRDPDRPGLTLHHMPYGACPVQADGVFDGVPFYFRARGQDVTIGVGEDAERVNVFGPSGEGDWRRSVIYSDDPYAAGYISDDEALSYIRGWYDEWREERDASGAEAG